MKKHILIRIMTTVLFIALSIQSVCFQGGSDYVQAAVKRGISKSYFNLTVGKSEKITLSGDKIKSVKSSKAGVVKVNKKGRITAKKTGKVKLTVTGKSGKKYICKVTVKAGLNYTKKTLNVGSSFKLVLYGSKIKKIRSLNPVIAKVSKKGKVTAIKAGTASIKVTGKNKKKYTCKVTVKGNTINPSDVIANGGDNNDPGNSSNNPHTIVTNNTTEEPKQTPTPDTTTDSEMDIRILADGTDNNYISTEKDKYELTGIIKTGMTVKSLTCNISSVVNSDKKDMVVSGVKKWAVNEAELEIGSNFFEFTATTSDGKTYTETITVMRISTEIKAASNVVGFDVNDSEQMEMIKEIHDDIIDVVNEEDEVRIIVTESNPLYTSILAGDIKKDDIVYIPANQYFITEITYRYKYYEDYNGNNMEIDSSRCKVLHMENVDIVDMFDGDVAISTDKIKEEDPIAFIYSPYAEDNEMMTMALDDKPNESDEKVNTVNGSGVQKENLANVIENVDCAGIFDGKLELNSEVVLYDEDGNAETENDQLKLDLLYKVSDIKPVFDIERHAISKSISKMVCGMESTEKLDVSFGVGAKINAEDIVKKINGGYKNEIGLDWAKISGVDVDDTVFLGAIGIRLATGTSLIGINTIKKYSTNTGFTPVVVFSFILNLKGELEIKAKLSFNEESYNVRGMTMYEESIFDKIAKSFTGKPSKKSITIPKGGLSHYVIEEYRVKGESKEKPDSLPISKVTLEIKGTVEGEFGIGAAVGLMIYGVMPVMVRTNVGPYLKGQAYVNAELSNSKQNKPNEALVFDGNAYLSVSGNAEIKTGVQLKFDIRIKVKVEVEDGWAKGEISYENTNNTLDLFSIGFSALKLKGKVYELIDDSSGNETKVGVAGAKISVKHNEVVDDSNLQSVTADPDGNFELQNIVTTNDTDGKFGNYTINIEKDGYESYKEDAWELSEPEEIDKIHEFILEKGLIQIIGVVTEADKDLNNSNNKLLENVKVSVYKCSDDTLFSSEVTDSKGSYKVDNVELGKYRLVFEKEGYKPAEMYVNIQNVYTSYYCCVVEVILEKDAGIGVASGELRDATNGEIIQMPLNMYIYKGYNNDGTEGKCVRSIVVTNGKYELELDAGQYTAIVRDEKMNPNYEAKSFNILVLGNVKISNQNAYLNPILKKGQLRAILNWGTSPDDLDLHLLSSGNSHYHIYFDNDYEEDYDTEEILANLDIDEIYGEGPETITVEQMDGSKYHILVHDYSNKDSTYSNDLARSRAYVTIYVGDTDTPIVFNVPNTDGNLWDICEIDSATGSVRWINEMRYEQDEENVR